MLKKHVQERRDKMQNLQAKIYEFLKHNEMVCYYDYVKRGNGIDPRKREDNLNNLVLYLIKGYNYIYLTSFPVPEPYKKIFDFMDTIFSKDMPIEEKLEKIKNVLFRKEKSKYQETLKVIEFIQCFLQEVLKDSYLPSVIDLVIQQEEQMQEIKFMLEYLEPTETSGETRKRKIS